MVNSLVERATNNMLIGPDWSLNLEICDICNHDPVQAKDVIKGIKKRLGSKNPKVQLLALTLLETLVKNCGDYVHLQVAERNVLTDMVKIVKKKHPDFHVKEKILVLIDTWQEAFGGARARYPQYYAAYHDLLRLGASFPEKSEISAPPVLTPPQTQPISSYPHNLGNQENVNENIAAVRSAEAEPLALSMTEMQNARGIMDVLAEMLTAIDPQKKEGLKQEVIVDLVEQCRTYKRRVVHLVNSTSDESLLSQGLSLNDDLERVLAKHDSLLTGTYVPSVKSKPETSRALVPVNPPLTDTKKTGSTSRTGLGADLISLAPVTSNGTSTTPPKVYPMIDLLSGDDYDTSPASNALAIVPVNVPQPTTPVSQNNALALVDMYSQNNAYSPSPQIQHQKLPAPPRHESWSPYNQGNSLAWNGHVPQQQQSPSPGYGATSGGLPLPPWEAQPQPTDNRSLVTNYSFSNGLQTGHHQNTGNRMPLMTTNQPGYTSQLPQQQFQGAGGVLQTQPNQMGYVNPQQMAQQMAQQMYNNQMAQQMYINQMAQQMYNNKIAQQANGYGNGYGYGYEQQQQQQNTQYIDQRMSGMSMSSMNTVYTGPSMANASYVHKPQKEEDRLFGDLVSFSKVKPMNKSTPGRAS